MRREKRWPFAVLMTTGLLMGCSRENPAAKLTMCTEPRPEACTRDYVPVCGSAKEGAAKTYGNACEACADASVAAWAPGECP
jgi:Kazal-type serine protease inhibitor domain